MRRPRPLGDTALFRARSTAMDAMGCLRPLSRPFSHHDGAKTMDRAPTCAGPGQYALVLVSDGFILNFVNNWQHTTTMRLVTQRPHCPSW